MWIAALLLAGLAWGAEPEAPVFQGESCTQCHELLRDAEGPPALEAVEEPRREVVVVGGGLSGLSAGHFLKDRDVLVLEKEARPGGHARRESFPEGKYPVAAVYMVEGYGPIGTLLKDVGLEPHRIKDPAEMLLFGDRYIGRWLSKGASEFPPGAREEMVKLSREIERLSKRDFTIPVRDSDPALLKAYEGVTFWDWLEKGFGPTAAKLGDMFAKDMFGAGAREVSAFMGILYIIDEFVPGYSWEGGLGAVSEAVAGSLGERVRTGATVVSSKQGPEGVTVEYLREGKLHRVKADAAVFATHHFITLRIAKDLTPAKAEAFRSMRYSSYLIVPLAFREKVWDRSFSLWNADTFLTDITFAGPQALEGGGEASGPGQVGTAYIPLGVEEGRTYLLNTTDEEIVARVKADLDKLLPGAAAKVREARVIRWGHAMPVMGPGFFKTLQPILEKPEGRYVFAGEDVQAPALEGAVMSAHQAAGEARRILSRVK